MSSETNTLTTQQELILRLSQLDGMEGPAAPKTSPAVCRTVLVVDDEPPVRGLLKTYLQRRGFCCETAGNGQEALVKLKSDSFALVITDVQMPDMTGLQLMGTLRNSHPDVAVMVISGVAELGTAIESMKQGASDYITKPFDLEQVVDSVGRALEARNRRLEEQQFTNQMEHLLHQKSSDLELALNDIKDHRDMILEALVRALDARENETQHHSQRVRAYTIRLAEAFCFDDNERVDLARGALLHDIGKIGVADSILLKPGKLSPKEWVEMKKHPTVGYQMLKGFNFLSRAARMVLHHHERFDGKGYPSRLKGEEIPLASRLFALTDAYDAMTSDRPYRGAPGAEIARSEIQANCGSQFDPQVVRAFFEIPAGEWDQIRWEHQSGSM